MHALMNSLDNEWSSTQDPEVRELVASIGAYSIVAFCGSFRGPEVFLVDLFGLRKYMQQHPRDDGVECIIVPLLGRFRGETGEQYYLKPLAAVTSSGLNVRLWLRRLIFVREVQGRLQGPAFSDEEGNIAHSCKYELAIMDHLAAIQEADPDLIPKDMGIYEEFGISRSFRRGATSTARAQGVDDRQVDLVNRWRSFESARGRKPRFTMHDHYSDIRILIPELIMFSKAL